jgi:hypothetical protein
VHGLYVTEGDLDALIKTISNAVEMDTTSVEIGFGLHYLIRMLKMGQLRSWELRGRNKNISKRSWFPLPELALPRTRLLLHQMLYHLCH